MTNKGCISTKTLLSLTLILITAFYTIFTWRMTVLMGETNRAELRPYLYIKLINLNLDIKKNKCMRQIGRKN